MLCDLPGAEWHTPWWQMPDPDRYRKWHWEHALQQTEAAGYALPADVTF